MLQKKVSIRRAKSNCFSSIQESPSACAGENLYRGIDPGHRAIIQELRSAFLLLQQGMIQPMHQQEHRCQERPANVQLAGQWVPCSGPQGRIIKHGDSNFLQVPNNTSKPIREKVQTSFSLWYNNIFIIV